MICLKKFFLKNNLSWKIILFLKIFDRSPLLYSEKFLLISLISEINKKVSNFLKLSMLIHGLGRSAYGGTHIGEKNIIVEHQLSGSVKF